MSDPIRDEIEFHLEQRTQELIEAGLPEDEARRAAETAFGNRREIESECGRLRRRREWRAEGWALLETVRAGLRGLRRHPAYALLVVGTLALGIGSTAAMFSVVDVVLIEPLPFAAPDRLVRVAESDVERPLRNPAPADFLDLRTEIPAFAAVTAFVPRGGNLTGGGEPERVRFADVSANFFHTLGVQPIVGRSFGPETVPEGQRLAVIGHGLWTRRFGADPGIVGRTLDLDGVGHEIVGVMPRGFAYPDDVDLWVPAPFDIPAASVFGADAPTIRDAWYHTVVARLGPGETPERAGDQLAALSARLRESHPDGFGDAQLWLQPLHDVQVGDLRSTLLLLLGATGLVLLIVAANVAHLALVRAADRSREWGVRLALGSPRSRLATLVLSESLALALVGGALGVALATLGIRILRPIVAPLLPVTSTLSVDGTVLGFALLLSLGVAVVFGVTPALVAARRPPGQGIDRGAGARSGSRRERRLREALVAGEIALAVVLVLGGGLLFRSLASLQRVDLGFEPAPLITMSVGFPGAADLPPAEQIRYYEDLTDRLGALAGVEAVAWGQFGPVEAGAGAGLRIRGEPDDGPDQSVRWHSVSADYFGTVGVEIVEGRAFTAADRAETEPVAVINQTLARRFFADGDAVGRWVNTGLDGRTDEGWHWVRVIGVAGDLRNLGPARPPEPMLYRPMAQQPPGAIGGPRAVLHLRTERQAPDLVGPVRAAVWAVNPDAPIDDVLWGEEIGAAYLGGQRLVLSLVAGFALVALLLGALGVYGIARHAVLRRTREIGVRMAIGADREAVVGLVVRESLRPALVGLLAGLAASVVAGRLLESRLVGVQPLDGPTYLVVPLLLATVSVLATWLPARRAAHIDPVRAMRVE